MSEGPTSVAGKTAAIIGLLFQLGPLVGLGLTVTGMIAAFHNLGSTGISDPKVLSVAIGTVLTATMLGLILGCIGLVLISYALVFARVRTPWFFGALIAVALLWILSFPLGTLFGAVLLIYLFLHRAEFGARPPGPLS